MTVKSPEVVVVAIAAAALALVMTWPLAIHLGSRGRVDTADGRFSIWNVAWVAHALVTDPRHVFDANIFYPHKDTLAYSENNLGAGVLAAPVYRLTRNPFAAHNFAVLSGFVLSALGMYCLVRLLTGNRAAAAIAGICFAFTPYVFAHSAHIQLQMTAGLPFSMFFFHRLAARISIGRGAALGAAMAATAIFCGYYGVFVILMVGYASLVVAAARGWWTNLAYWRALAAGAVVSIAVVSPAFLPYLSIQQNDGFRRQLDDARPYSANWSDYLASPSNLHSGMLPYLPPWTEVTFPGFIATGLGVASLWVARKRFGGELFAIYGGLIVLAAWASFGPAGGLYAWLYRALPLFTWLRAPARLGLIVVMGMAALTGLSVAAILDRVRSRAAVAIALGLLAIAELKVSSNLREVEPFDPVYRTLATLPPGPVVELPFYYVRGMFPLHTQYMLNSTTHWMPLVNGYSDHIPQDFFDNVMTLAPFPTPAGMKLLEPGHVRYAVFHLGGYIPENRRDVETRLKQLEDYFRPLYVSENTRLYEIVAYPR